MSEPFDAIGFHLANEAAFQHLAEEARAQGAVSRVPRERGVLNGCCWQLGAGIEVWTMFYETREGAFFADCRPAFRSQQIFRLYPWEIAEYEEDAEAIARGTFNGEQEIVFALQNITEIDPADFRERPIVAVLAGLAYRARVNTRPGTPVFARLDRIYAHRKSLENDYAVRGPILSWREIKNGRTASDLLVVSVDAGKIKVEVVVRRDALKGELKRGGWFSSEVWLQGHILNDRELRLRYEGVDHEMPPDLIWQRLRRMN
jgi:hypothetical protein